MKELSIEEKARRYDEAIKRLEDIETGNCQKTFMFTEGLFDYIFPELKESEDERIRKHLISLFKKFVTLGVANECETSEIKVDDILFWLEKQVQNPVDKVEPKFKVGDLIKYDEDGELNRVVEITSDGYKLEHGNHILCFSSQDYWELVEDSVSEDERVRKELKSLFLGWINGSNPPLFAEECNRWIAWLEKQWQKPADIEPKFKVGDWVVRNGETLQISDIVTVLDGTFHYWFTKGTWLSSKKMENAMLWTIQDAKDGDIVVDKSDGAIGIFQSIGHHPDGGSYNDPSYCFLHCRYDDGFFYADFEYGNTIDSDDLIPATKEQCGTLERAMADAGYTFDFVKKELKKIQNTWKPSDEQMEALLKLEEMHVLEHEKNQENAHLYMVVKSLREQLKKLREE